MWIKVIDRTQRPKPGKPTKPRPQTFRLKFEDTEETVRPGSYLHLPYPTRVQRVGSDDYEVEVTTDLRKPSSVEDAARTLREVSAVLPLTTARKVYVWIPTWILILAVLLILLVFALGVLFGWWLL